MTNPDAPRQFGRMPTEIIASGAMRAIKGRPAALLTYIAYVAAADANMEAWPSEAWIVKAFEINPDSVRRARRTLEHARLLIDTGRRKHRCKVYRIATKPRADTGYKPRSAPGSENDTPNSARRNPEQRAAETPNGRGTNRGEQKEQSVRAPSGAPGVMTFATKAGEWPLSRQRLDQYRTTYPGIDIDAELRKARQWCIDNPSKRKTTTGMPRFLNGWLSRAKPENGNGSTNDIPLDADPVEPPDEVFLP